MRTLTIAMLLALLAATACAPVRPWEREHLARPEMGWDPDPLAAALASHIQFSKEGSLRGGAAGGGGCGCN